MEKYTAKEAREKFGDVIAKAAHGSQRVIITKNGRDAVGIVSMADLALLADIERLIDLSQAEREIAKVKTEGTVTLEKLKKDLGL